jgi:hypothetical protein
MRYLILIALLLVGCVTKPTPELVARQFEASAYGNDHGQGSPVLVRWQEPIRLTPTSDDKKIYLPHKDQMISTLSGIQRIAGITIEGSETTEGANVLMMAMPRGQFAQAIDNLPKKPSYSDQMAYHSLCFGIVYSDDAGVVAGAVIGIATDIPEADRRDCIPEELFQTMGLVGDACHYRPSLICESDRRVFEMQPADRLMLAVLYDPALQTGMTREQAMPIVRRLIRERWAEYMGP